MFRHRFSPHNDNAMNVDLDSKFLKDQSPDDDENKKHPLSLSYIPCRQL